MLLADAIKDARRNKKPLKTGTQLKREPIYYPQLPLASVHGQEGVLRDPMAPLQAPWPRLPPLNDNRKQRKHSSTSLPPSVRHFLDAQQGRY